MRLAHLVTGLVLFISAVANAQMSQNFEYLPTFSQWVEHANDLKKYWLHPDAYGVPVGNFPTWRCDDGTLRNQKRCKGEQDIGGLMELTPYDFTRMQARQTFAYGALFNLTGDIKALELHQAGVEFLLKKAIDPEGGFYNIFENGKPFKDANSVITGRRLNRTSQDLSYALVGLAMNAYLTHDKRVIDVIKKSQKYIYDTYFDKDSQLMKWCLEDSVYDRKDQKELVGLLDQLNAYMILTWRVLPKKDQAEWSKLISKTVKAINKNFYNAQNNRFWGCTDNESCFVLDKGRHLDNGHTVKAFWMEYLAARGLDDDSLERFAKNGMKDTLKSAQTAEGNDWFGDLLYNRASWWEYAELNQAALTLALTDDYILHNTFYPWINEAIDKEYGEIGSYGLKTFFWRNGFHTTEHALIGAILSNGIRLKYCQDNEQCEMDNYVRLYFAPVNYNDRNFTPYLYSGDIVYVKDLGKVKEVVFDDIELPDEVDD
ncbi:MAG: hypothetical protein ACI4UM_08065 [Succinivibrio sp.]